MEDASNRRRQRDSHDLSVQLTRYSVVDSMLLSLAGFGESPGAPPTNFESSFSPPNFNINDDPYVDSPPLPTTRRNRGHTYSSSMSDYESANINDTASRYTAYHANARANATGPQPQKQSRTERPRDTNSYPPSSLQSPIDEQPSMPFRSRASKVHHRKDSDQSSVETGNGPRWARAASFDHSIRDGGLRHTPKRAPRPPPLDTARDPMPEYTTFDDAAPTPTVPGGPRRRQEAMAIPSAPVTPRKSAPSRQNSVKSSRAGKKGKTSSVVQDSSIRDQARQFVTTTNNIRNGQAIPTVTGPSAAPSPTVGGTRKTFPSPTVAQPPPKEKPGFFRKFFGSSKSSQNSNTQHDDHANQYKRNSSGAPDRPRTQPTQAPSGHFQSASRPPTQDNHTSRGEVTQTLRKSTSSFFRRRKKSFGENVEVIPPVPPLQIHQYQAQTQTQNQNQNQSQSQNQSFSRLSLMNGVQAEENSLRNIMAPYLADAVSPFTAPETYYDSREHQPKQEAAGDTRIPDPEKSSNRDVVSSGHGALDSSRQSVGTNSERSRTLDSGSMRQISSVRGIMRGLHGSDEVNYSGGISYRNTASKSPPFLSDNAFQALERIDSPADVAEPSEPSEPSRPAPGVPPSELPYSTRRAAPGGSLTPKMMDKAALSPISDHSFLSSSASTPLAFDPTAEDFRLHQEAGSNEGGSRRPKSPRVWLRPSDSDEDLRKNKTDLSSAADGIRHSPKSPQDFFSSATSLPIVQVDDKELDMDLADDSHAIPSSDKSVSDEDRVRARQIFEGDESLVSKALAASWLGHTAAINTSTRRAYMELYDWSGLNILAAFRELCSRLVVRAESQQLDRVIEAFSERWCESNPNNGFKDRGKRKFEFYTVPET
jgi:Sec7 domain